MIRFILRLFDLIAPLIRALNVDYGQFRAILETKLILDNRRRNGGFQRQRQGKANKPINGLVIMLVYYAIMGAMIAGVVAFTPPLLGAAILHAFVMVMVGLSLIADFSSVLLDTTDNAILQPRPLTGRTILVARVAHIVVYLASLSLSLSVVPVIAGTLHVHALYALVYLPTLVCSVGLMVVFANLFYLLVMRVTTGERLRDLLAYVQIAMAVVMIGSFQLMPRLMNLAALYTFRMEDHRWLYWLPPVWCAAPIDMLVGHVGAVQILLSMLAVAAPLAGMLAVVFVFAPRFNRALLSLDADAGKARGAGGKEAGIGLGRRLGGWWCRTPVQRSAFELIWVLCGRDRQFKSRTYPSVAIALIMGFSFILAQGHGGGWWSSLEAARQTRAHLYMLYMVSFMVLTTLQHLRFSPQYEAAWVYDALPIGRPGEVLLAALKVILIRFVLPAYLLVAVAVAAIWGSRSAWDIMFAFGAMVFMSTLEAAFLARKLPFSEAFGAMEGAGRVGKTMGLMLIPAAVGGFHYACGSSRVALASVLAVLVVATWLLARRYGRTSWEELRRA